MAIKCLVGPILGLESDTDYTVCFLTKKDIKKPILSVSHDQTASTTKSGETPHGFFWRSTFKALIKSKSYFITYEIKYNNELLSDKHDRKAWTFYVPGKTEKPRIIYASCNGFSSADLQQKTTEPYFLWDKMAQMHETTPFSLLILGGDQVYADSVWIEVPSCRKWKELPRSKRIKMSATQKLKRELDRFYQDLYISRWGNKNMSLMLSSIPTLMMWDDHDIFDGWGSYPGELQSSPMYQAIFSAAKRYFELFQIRSKKNSSLLSKNQEHYSFGVKYRNFYILGLDNRSQRTLSQVMHDEEDKDNTHWKTIIQQLKEVNTENLLVLSGLPVVYRDFSQTESLLDITPWQEELTDDIKDQWRAKQHQGERLRLIMHLLNSHNQRPNQNKKKTVILSGDVHVACLGTIIDRRVPDKISKVHQVVSSGIVHPPPSALAWIGITASSNDDKEYLNSERTIETQIINAVGADRYIRTRNFVYLVEGDDQNLWVNWICELGHDSEYPLE